MSEQSPIDALPEAEPAGCPPRWPLVTRLARHRPTGTTWVTLASVISFAILVTGCVGTAGIVPKAEPLATAAAGIDARSATPPSTMVGAAVLVRLVRPTPVPVGDAGPTAASSDAPVPWADDAPSPPGAHNPAAMAAAAGSR